MTNKILPILTAIIGLLGIVLIVGGIITDKNGAVIIGMCGAAIAAYQLIASRKQAK